MAPRYSAGREIVVKHSRPSVKVFARDEGLAVEGERRAVVTAADIREGLRRALLAPIEARFNGHVRSEVMSHLDWLDKVGEVAVRLHNERPGGWEAEWEVTARW